MEKAIAWLDVETNGRNPETDSLLEVGLVITDFLGNQLSVSYSSLVDVRNIKELIAETEPFIQRMHENSGLWRDLWSQDSKSTSLIDEELTELVLSIPESPIMFLGGNSITLDRAFAKENLPNFYEAISHMSIDATTIASVLQENFSAPRFKKQQAHRALADVYDSIDEYCYYLNILENKNND